MDRKKQQQPNQTKQIHMTPETYNDSSILDIIVDHNLLLKYFHQKQCEK